MADLEPVRGYREHRGAAGKAKGALDFATPRGDV
jgi:hypothetical protein